MSKGEQIWIRELAEGYDEKRRMDPADFKRLHRLILKHGDVKGRFLEIGCGTGFHLVPLAQRLPGVCCCGIEPSYAMLVQARDKAWEKGVTNCHLVLADGHSLPFDSAAFDFVFISQVIHFFTDKPRAAAEVRRISSPEARLLVITTSHPQLRSQIDLSFFPGLLKKETARIPSVAEIRRLFEGQGFELYNAIEFATTFKARSADALAEWVARKPWSSYMLLSSKEFEQGLKGFRRRLKEAFGSGEIAYLVPQTLLFFRKL
jgi:ubiquinone/menaquinone biosynthesis C-methylase UbiE